jgi:hypothetical protein
MSFEHGVVTVRRPDGTLLHSDALLVEGPGIFEQNEALGVRITPETVASQWDGRRRTPEPLADTVTGLLWLEDGSRHDVEAVNATPAAAEPEQEYEADYPDVIVIDDEDYDDLAVWQETG